MKPQDWIKAGYKRFEHVKHIRPYAEYGFQKLISDNNGKKYYITVFVYDNSEYLEKYNMQQFSFSPDVQFETKEGFTMNIELLLNEDSTITQVEQQLENLWLNNACKYYERWDYSEE